MSKIDIDALIAEVLRLDACASRDWRQDNCRIRRGAAAPLLTTTAHGEPVFIAYDDASAAVHCRTAAPVLAREVQRLMLRLAEVERERDEARAALEEARLTLAAEQGRQEGAPSEGWRWTSAVWFHPATRMVVEPMGRLWRLNPDVGDPRHWRLSRLTPMPARAAMQAADEVSR